MDEVDRSQEGIKRTKEARPEFVFFSDMVDKATTYQREGAEVKILLDEEKIREAIDMQRKTEVRDEVSIPDFKEKSRKSLENILRLVVKRKMFPLKILHKAAELSVPKDTKTAEWNYSEFSSSQLPEHFENNHSKDKVRPRHVTFGEKAIKGTAERYKTFFEDLNITLSEEQYVDIAFAVTAAHEQLGHGMQFALQERGENFFRLRNRISSELNIYRLTDAQQDKVFEEYWARGIEDMVLGLYLTDTIGLTIEERDRFMKMRSQFDREYLSEFRNSLLKVQKPDRAPNLWSAVQTYDEIGDLCEDHLDSSDISPASIIASCKSDDIFAYYGEPFTDAEINFVFEEHLNENNIQF